MMSAISRIFAGSTKNQRIFDNEKNIPSVIPAMAFGRKISPNRAEAG